MSMCGQFSKVMLHVSRRHSKPKILDPKGHKPLGVQDGPTHFGAIIVYVQSHNIKIKSHGSRWQAKSKMSPKWNRQIPTHFEALIVYVWIHNLNIKSHGFGRQSNSKMGSCLPPKITVKGVEILHICICMWNTKVMSICSLYNSKYGMRWAFHFILLAYIHMDTSDYFRNECRATNSWVMVFSAKSIYSQIKCIHFEKNYIKICAFVVIEISHISANCVHTRFCFTLFSSKTKIIKSIHTDWGYETKI